MGKLYSKGWKILGNEGKFELRVVVFISDIQSIVKKAMVERMKRELILPGFRKTEHPIL